MQWENTNEKPTTSVIDTFIAVKAKLVAILRRLDSLELKDNAQVNQVSSLVCTNCQAPMHITDKVSLLEDLIGQPKQVNIYYLVESKELPICFNL